MLSLPKAGAYESPMLYVKNKQDIAMVKDDNREEGEKKEWKEKEETTKKRDDRNIKAKVLQSEYVQDGEKWKLKWKDEIIGDYIDPGQPKPFDKYKQDTFRWEPVNVLLKKKKYLSKFHLIEGFANCCSCSGYDLYDKSFRAHIKDKHGGYIPPLSQLNHLLGRHWYIIMMMMMLNCFIVGLEKTWHKKINN